MSKMTYPDVTDPVVITASDGTLFVCWVEPIADELRWVYVSAQPPVRYAGPNYDGETSSDRMKTRLNSWWAARKLRGQAAS
jgi:hypothetical protein